MGTGKITKNGFFILPTETGGRRVEMCSKKEAKVKKGGGQWVEDNQSSQGQCVLTTQSIMIVIHNLCSKIPFRENTQYCKWKRNQKGLLEFTEALTISFSRPAKWCSR